MNADLNGTRVALLVAHGFEQSELEVPREALLASGATVSIVSPERDEVRAWDEVAFGNWFDVSVPLRRARAADFDALVLPGGVMNPDRLRTIPEAVEFARAFFQLGKPVAAICHGPQLLIEADAVRDRTLTSHPSIKTDLKNAGATWVDQEVVVDHGLITSRRPSDLPFFARKIIEVVSEAVQTGQRP